MQRDPGTFRFQDTAAENTPAADADHVGDASLLQLHQKLVQRVIRVTDTQEGPYDRLPDCAAARDGRRVVQQQFRDLDADIRFPRPGRPCVRVTGISKVQDIGYRV